MQPVRAITLRQPWASLTILKDTHGLPLKWVETRTWETSYRGEVYIHAGLTADKIDFDHLDKLERKAFKDAGLTCNEDILALPRGAVIGVAILDMCLPIENLYNGGFDTPRERAFGDWNTGRYGWVLSDAQPLAEPIAAKGKQGLWFWWPPQTNPQACISF